jgi:isoquinoline 1-oxidoreductase alpha subunit
MITLNVDGESMSVDVPDDTRLLWALRDVLGMTGFPIADQLGA